MPGPTSAPKLDLSEVEVRQAELLRLVDEMTAEADSDRQQTLVKRIAEASSGLERLCADLEAQARAMSKDERGYVYVELTSEQRAEVKQRTGVDLPVVEIDDPGGAMMRTMQDMPPDVILSFAIGQAESQAREEQAARAARAELDRLADELRRDVPEVIRQEVERLLADPDLRRALDPKARRRR